MPKTNFFPSGPLPERSGSIEHPNIITIEVADDEHTRSALERVCFDRKFSYRKFIRTAVGKTPQPGKVFYEIAHTDPVQLFWLGAAFQTYLNQ